MAATITGTDCTGLGDITAIDQAITAAMEQAIMAIDHVLPCDAAIVVSGCIFRIELYRNVVVGECPVVIVFLSVGGAAISVGLRVFWIDANCGCVIRDGTIEILRLKIAVAAIILGEKV